MENPITLSYLRVSSRTVLGETAPLLVASPCSFSNAKGNLREVQTYKELATIGEASGNRLRGALATSITKK